MSPSFLLAQAIFEPKLFPYKFSSIFKPGHSSHVSAYEDGTECSETSAYKIQVHGNYPEEGIQHSEQGESLKLKSRSVEMSLKFRFELHFLIVRTEVLYIFFPQRLLCGQH
jgi:hypothetical protein